MKTFTLSFLLISSILFQSCNSIKENKSTNNITEFTIIDGSSTPFTINLKKGKHFNHPTFVIWLEDEQENIINTIFITNSIATKKYGQAYISNTTWSQDSGSSVRPASIPYYSHKINQKDNLVIDAFSGATPTGDCKINTGLSANYPKKIRLLVEVNQAWDWNKYWNNTKYLDKFEYKTSCQPSLVYAVSINTNSEIKEYFLNPIGHGHFAGENGNLYTDLSTFTTALEIFESISVTF